MSFLYCVNMDECCDLCFSTVCLCGSMLEFTDGCLQRSIQGRSEDKMLDSAATIHKNREVHRVFRDIYFHFIFPILLEQ